MKHILLAGLLSLGFVSFAQASILTLEGAFTLDHGSSIPGVPTGDRFHFMLTLDGSSVDQEHGVFENGDPSDPVRGVTALGRYEGAVIQFQMTRDPANSGSWDPSLLTYDLLGSTLLTTDANPPATGDPLDFMNEHLTVSIGVETPGSAVQRIYFNLYNSTIYEPYATRHLWLDASTADNGFKLSDLFLHGLDTLTEFRSLRGNTNFELKDSAFLDGGIYTGSGTVQDLVAVPEPSSIVVHGIGGIAFMVYTRRRRRHTKWS
jgi:hypothetical protein